MGRKPLNEIEREQKRLFDEELKKHSLDALKNIWKIANNAMDVRVRLQANQWIVERTYGKDYQLFREHEEQQLTGNVTINLLPVPTKQYDYSEIEKQIKENLEDDLADSTEWNLDEDWGENDFYTP